MSNLLQVVLPVVIPAAVGFLIAYQGALSRPGRLRRNVKADVELLAALPAEHPSREQLAGHVGKLVDELIWREERQYFPVVSWLRYRFGFVWFVAFTVAMVAGVVWAVLVATGVLPPRVVIEQPSGCLGGGVGMGRPRRRLRLHHGQHMAGETGDGGACQSSPWNGQRRPERRRCGSSHPRPVGGRLTAPVGIPARPAEASIPTLAATTAGRA